MAMKYFQFVSLLWITTTTFFGQGDHEIDSSGQEARRVVFVQ
jgi:hypothetical protein